jgi:hypothetical protein
MIAAPSEITHISPNVKHRFRVTTQRYRNHWKVVTDTMVMMIGVAPRTGVKAVSRVNRNVKIPEMRILETNNPRFLMIRFTGCKNPSAETNIRKIRLITKTSSSLA